MQENNYIISIQIKEKTNIPSIRQSFN